MKLFYLPGACSLADHIVLEWIGLPYEAVAVPRDQLKGKEFLAINPAGSVPALRLDDGSVLTQNVAILDYLSSIAPQAGLSGDGTPLSRADVLRWTTFLNADVHPSFSHLFAAARFVDGEEAQANLKQKAKSRLRGDFERLDAQIGDGVWLVGNCRSIADTYLYVVTRWAHAMQVDLSGLDNLARHFEHMSADAGVKAALGSEGLN